MSLHLSKRVRCFLFFLPLQRPTSRTSGLILRQAPRSAASAATKRGSVAAMRRKGNCFVQAEPGGSASAAVASERSLARRSMRGPGATRLHVLRWALVILCLPRTDGSAASIFVAPHQPSPPPSPGSPPSPGCREDTVEDAFFSTELSSAFFPHSGYTPVPDPDPSECDITIDVPWTAGKSMVQMRDRIIEEGDFKCNAKTSNCATCDLWTWPLVPASCARRPVAICVKPGTCE